MTTPHRPLCEWITDIPAGPDGIADWDPWVVPNGGDRWSDARQLPRFDDDWYRLPVRLRTSSGEHTVLGLARGQEVVVELDDTAAPVPVSLEALELIDRYERSWPDVSPEDGDLARLEAESPVLRHALLDRLAAEAGSVRPALFHVLPWDAVTTLAGEVAAELERYDRGEPGRASQIRLRHWFTPTGSRFSAALDQLNAGIGDGNAALIREGANALCTRLLEADLRRFPEPARQALAALAARLAERDPLLAVTASRAVERLRGTGRRDEPRRWIHSDLELAASPSDDRREYSEEIRVGPLLVDVAVTRGGMLAITAEFELTAEQARAAAEVYGTVIVRLRITRDEDGSRIVLVPMSLSRRRLSGAVDLPAPGGLVAVVPDGAPFGAAETWRLDASDVRASFAVAGERTKAAWRALAAGSPPGHPVVRALRELGELGEGE